MSAVRIVKRGKPEVLTNMGTPDEKKTRRQNTREIVNTVKSWIAEIEERHRNQVRPSDVWTR